MHRHRLSVLLFSAVATLFLSLLAFSTVKNASRDKALIRHNALSQGYWIARSLEIGHRMMMDDHVNALREIAEEVAQKPDIQLVMVLDDEQQVMIASDVIQKGKRWPEALGPPSESGRIIRSKAGAMELVFPAFFAKAFQHMSQHAPGAHGDLDKATWVLLRLDVSEELAHYRASVIQSVGISLSVVILGLAAFWFFGMIQRYHLANASLEQLEQFKHHLARFVPGTVQKLIEENPEQPLLDKVEREATVLFLDIDHYTTMAAEMAPDALNHLIETYFSSFLDIILSYGGEINETAGDGIMAIFIGKTAYVHARNSVKAAVDIREKATALNLERDPQCPEIFINIGINTGKSFLAPL